MSSPGEINTSGDLLWFLDALAAVRADASSTGGTFGLTEVWAPRGHGSGLHRHTRDDESFFVIEGELTVWLGDVGPTQLPAGCLVTLPRGTPHAFEVTSDVARFCAICTPAGGEELVRLVGTPAARAALPPPPQTIDGAAIPAALAQLGQQIVGPRPAS
jgi:mannose-6-phosphate isomerase-like protein (cupin superfamily)